MREAQGKYNPVTGEWTQPQDPSVATAYAKQFNREQIVGRGHGAGLRESSYDPIRGVYRDRPPTAPPPAERTLVKKQASGESWGQYNPINHTWREAPRDARFVDRNAHTERVLAFTGRSMAHPTTMQRHGAYNPIIGEWKVLPAEPREAAMYCAHATTMFTQQRFTDKQ